MSIYVICDLLRERRVQKRTLSALPLSRLYVVSVSFRKVNKLAGNRVNSNTIALVV